MEKRFPTSGPVPFTSYDWKKPSDLYRVTATHIIFGAEEATRPYFWYFNQPDRGWVGVKVTYDPNLGYINAAGQERPPRKGSK